MWEDGAAKATVASRIVVTWEIATMSSCGIAELAAAADTLYARDCTVYILARIRRAFTVDICVSLRGGGARGTVLRTVLPYVCIVDLSGGTDRSPGDAYIPTADPWLVIMVCSQAIKVDTNCRVHYLVMRMKLEGYI
jgi:hypothetical protein